MVNFLIKDAIEELVGDFGTYLRLLGICPVQFPYCATILRVPESDVAFYVKITDIYCTGFRSK